MPASGKWRSLLKLFMDFCHQRVVVLLVSFHDLNILLLSLLDEIVQPALLVLRGGWRVNNQR